LKEENASKSTKDDCDCENRVESDKMKEMFEKAKELNSFGPLI
jgi:hypothetical protein